MQKGQVFVEESKPIWAHPAGAYDFLSGERLGEHLRPLVSSAFIYHELLKKTNKKKKPHTHLFSLSIYLSSKQYGWENGT